MSTLKEVFNKLYPITSILSPLIPITSLKRTVLINAKVINNNHIIRGFNIESKAYPTTLCAERVAIFSALSQGYRKFSAMAIVTNDQGSPCGGCRQIMYEYLGNIPIIIANKEKDILRTTVLELLPNPFG